MESRRESKKTRNSLLRDTIAGDSEEETTAAQAQLDAIDHSNGALVVPTHFDGDLVTDFRSTLGQFRDVYLSPNIFSFYINSIVHIPMHS